MVVELEEFPRSQYALFSYSRVSNAREPMQEVLELLGSLAQRISSFRHCGG